MPRVSYHGESDDDDEGAEQKRANCDNASNELYMVICDYVTVISSHTSTVCGIPTEPSEPYMELCSNISHMNMYMCNVGALMIGAFVLQKIWIARKTLPNPKLI